MATELRHARDALVAATFVRYQPDLVLILALVSPDSCDEATG